MWTGLPLLPVSQSMGPRGSIPRGLEQIWGSLRGTANQMARSSACGWNEWEWGVGSKQEKQPIRSQSLKGVPGAGLGDAHMQCGHDPDVTTARQHGNRPVGAICFTLTAAPRVGTADVPVSQARRPRLGGTLLSYIPGQVTEKLRILMLLRVAYLGVFTVLGQFGLDSG